MFSAQFSAIFMQNAYVYNLQLIDFLRTYILAKLNLLHNVHLPCHR